MPYSPLYGLAVMKNFFKKKNDAFFGSGIEKRAKFLPFVNFFLKDLCRENGLQCPDTEKEEREMGVVIAAIRKEIANDKTKEYWQKIFELFSKLAKLARRMAILETKTKKNEYYFSRVEKCQMDFTEILLRHNLPIEEMHEWFGELVECATYALLHHQRKSRYQRLYLPCGN